MDKFEKYALESLKISLENQTGDDKEEIELLISSYASGSLSTAKLKKAIKEFDTWVREGLDAYVWHFATCDDIDEVDIARSIAEHAHYGQKRRGGEDYFKGHVLPVAKACFYKYGEKVDLICTAALHDVLEDTLVTKEELLEKGIPESVVTSVVAITKVKGESYMDYLKRVKADETARLVKIQDILHNISSQPTDKQVKKYAKALTFLLD